MNDIFSEESFEIVPLEYPKSVKDMIKLHEQLHEQLQDEIVKIFCINEIVNMMAIQNQPQITLRRRIK